MTAIVPLAALLGSISGSFTFAETFKIHVNSLIRIKKVEKISKNCLDLDGRSLSLTISSPEAVADSLSMIQTQNEYLTKDELKTRCKAITLNQEIPFNSVDILSNEFESNLLIIDNGFYCNKAPVPPVEVLVEAKFEFWEREKTLALSFELVMIFVNLVLGLVIYAQRARMDARRKDEKLVTAYNPMAV
mgnify:CR=1 FL=1